MFGEAGRIYIYFVYGIHHMLNIVAGKKDYPAAILIRGAGGINGPAKLTKFLDITKKINGKKADPKTGVWFEDRGEKIPLSKIKRTPRIGVQYAGKIWANKPYRFIIRD